MTSGGHDSSCVPGTIPHTSRVPTPVDVMACVSGRECRCGGPVGAQNDDGREIASVQRTAVQFMHPRYRECSNNGYATAAHVSNVFGVGRCAHPVLVITSIQRVLITANVSREKRQATSLFSLCSVAMIPFSPSAVL